MTRTTLIDHTMSPSTRRSVGYELVLIGVGAALIALASQIAFRLPFTPVPVTGQTFSVLLAGMLLGARRGAASALAYLLAGAVGLPVFAAGGGGIGALTGYTAGYLLAFPVAAACAGALAERGWDRRPWTAAAAMLMSSAAILGCGGLWLSRYVGGLGNAFAQGVAPFLISDVAKAVLAACLLPTAWRFLRRTPGPEGGA